MPATGLLFATGAVLPACRVHIDRVFPDLAAVQFLRAGSLYFQRGKQVRREWRQPVFFWTDLHSHYRYGPGSTGSWDHRWVSFRGPALRSHLLPLLDSLAPEGVLPVSNADEVDELIRRLVRVVVDQPEDGVAATHLLHRLLAAVHDGRPGRAPPDPLVRAVRGDIDATPAAAVSFPALARRHGLSYSAFRRRFREQVGLAPHAYLISRRLREAARLLTATTLSAQEIGDRVGYADPRHFSKAFKRQYGLAPRDFRDARPT